jgi:hypothetical protein
VAEGVYCIIIIIIIIIILLIPIAIELLLVIFESYICYHMTSIFKVDGILGDRQCEFRIAD